MFAKAAVSATLFGAPEEAAASGTPSPEAAPADAAKRPLVSPSDDGSMLRGEPDATRGLAETPDPDGEPEDAALAIPRVILAPVRAASNLVFLPARGALYFLGRYKVIENVEDFLYNDERTAAVLPTLSFTGEYGVTVGVNAFHEGLGRHHERVSVSARFGGVYTQAYELEVEAPRVGGAPFSLSSVARFEMEPQTKFFGYGPGAEVPPPPALVGPRQANVLTQFRQRRAFTHVRAGAWLTDEVNLGVIGAYTARHFGAGTETDNDDPSIETVYDVHRIPGFDDGYALASGLLDLRVDTRQPSGATATGVYVRALAGGPPPQHGFGYFHYAAEIAGYIDLYGGDRVLVLHAAHEGTTGDDEDVPFTELPRLGGNNRLRGYDRHRFRDHFTALTTVEYHYPIHEYVAGSVFIDVGSVGRTYAELAKPSSYKVGGGGGFLFRSRDTKLFSVQLAYGEDVKVVVTTDPLMAFEKRSEEL
jgi:hypothetical protein